MLFVDPESLERCLAAVEGNVRLSLRRRSAVGMVGFTTRRGRRRVIYAGTKRARLVAAISRQIRGEAMAKRTTSGTSGGPTTGGARSASGGDSAEDRFLALAEQLGRIVGTMQAKAGGWLDRDALMQQLSQVRDGATHLLEQIGVTGAAAQTSTASTTTAQTSTAPTSATQESTAQTSTTKSSRAQTSTARKTARGSSEAQGSARPSARQSNRPTPRGRSGGVVDAPGKQHRKPVANETIANAADTGRIAKMKTINAKRRRGR
jgi:hypothetical protein